MGKSIGNISSIAGLLAIGVGSTASHAQPARTGLRTAPPPASAATARATARADGDWPSQNRTLASARYAPLDQITTANVASLKRVCTAALDDPQPGSFQSGIVVVNNTMFATTLQNTYAFDAATCRRKWKHAYAFTRPKIGLAVNRGVAYAGGKVFRGIDAGYLIALDAETGKQLWRTKVSNMQKGETVPAAPVAWNGLVFIGQAGGDVKGVRGRMMAFRQSDGRQTWNFEFVPMTGPGSETWAADTPDKPRSGAATWSSYTIDETSGLLYVATGNAAPDFDTKIRPGKNLYTNSVVILDAKTGAYKHHYVVTPHDFHDWDLSSTPVLITTTTGKDLLVQGAKDGHVYAIDESQHKEVYKTAVTTIENADAPLSADKATRFCPGKHGGVQQNGPAFHPTANMLFVNSVDLCTSVTLAPLSAPPTAVGQQWTGAVPTALFGTDDPKSQWKGWLTALDADNGSVKWKYQSPTPLIAGVTTTAGGLVFTGDLNGDVMAFDAMSGRQLWKQNTGAPIGSGMVTYLAGGKQYVAVAVGMSSLPVIFNLVGGAARIAVYTLP